MKEKPPMCWRGQDFPWVIDQVPLAEIRVDNGSSGYQRELRKRGRDLAAKWEPAKYEPIGVCLREDGSAWCTDGQARLVAAVQLGYRELPVRLFHHSTRTHEADLFLGANEGRVNVRAYDRYRAALVKGEPYALAARRVAKAFGLQIGRHVAAKTLGSIDALRRIFELGGEELLRRTVGVVIAAWGADRPDALGGQMVRGIALLLSELDADEDRAIGKRLKRTAPDAILLAASKAQAARRAKSYAAVAYVAQAIANQCDIPWTIKRAKVKVVPPGSGADATVAVAAKSA